MTEFEKERVRIIKGKQRCTLRLYNSLVDKGERAFSISHLLIVTHSRFSCFKHGYTMREQTTQDK